ncbi:MAG: tRNA uridine-5-carboxymethylaminomethyl(34) synthesis GTPase MnmE, partial [Verrucomicrobiota bacterium]
MSVVKSLDSETIAAIATPRAAGALAVIRVSGKNAREIVGQCLAGGGKTSVNRFGAERKSCLRVVNDEEGRRIDECLVVWYGGPRSFTGEDVVELSCHGGLYGSRRVLERVLENGARLARSGEFSERAYMNGKLDLTQAEA